MVFHWSLSDSKSPQVSRTRLRILAVLSNAVVWIVSTCPPTSNLSPESEWQQASSSLQDSSQYSVVWIVSIRPLISKFSSPFTNPLVTVLRAPITIGITVTFTFHIFFNSLARSRYFLSILLCGQPGQQSPQVLFIFLLSIIRFGRLAEIRWSVCISKSLRSLWISFARTDSLLCIYHLFVWSDFNFLHSSQWITLPT